jgi:hypothetical protein
MEKTNAGRNVSPLTIPWKWDKIGAETPEHNEEVSCHGWKKI